MDVRICAGISGNLRMLQAAEIIRDFAKNFKVLNEKVWDILFPDWKNAIEDVLVDLTVGLPKVYDAVTDYNEQGDVRIIFNMDCWIEYMAFCDLEKTVNALLNHELFHVLIGKKIPEIIKAQNADYITRLNAGTFNEGFAHLIAHEGRVLEDIDWHSPKLEEVQQVCYEKMEKALKVADAASQKQWLEAAFCGSYYDKYACMCGMFYLEQIWEREGVCGLKRCLDGGYQNFAARTIGGFYNE